MSARKPYIRPMAGWWRRDPFFIEYMVHEGTAFFVLAYALELLAGVLCLASGEAAWNAYLVFSGSAIMLLINFAILLMMLYHGYTWFKIMPRTLPPVIISGQRLGAAVITATGIVAAVLASGLLLAVVCFLARGL
ncbi:fumarate reductase subunit C [Iodobacter sp. CM08]|uniref:fumarate reductase subunit C n=1 Tax=Iodobacter sp. CM08 TaxID=3085902 RepID=UPI00298181F6|nr:fumarate reductase subunit C [Iodobacter sp. CM08]MDW5416332.1 fumarate reductase subunit C [Iodobacter sp. CM08]